MHCTLRFPMIQKTSIEHKVTKFTRRPILSLIKRDNSIVVSPLHSHCRSSVSSFDECKFEQSQPTDSPTFNLYNAVACIRQHRL